jgi:hypothetical protein
LVARSLLIFANGMETWLSWVDAEVNNALREMPPSDTSMCKQVANPADFITLADFLGADVASFRQVIEHVPLAHATGLLLNTG